MCVMPVLLMVVASHGTHVRGRRGKLRGFGVVLGVAPATVALMACVTGALATGGGGDGMGLYPANSVLPSRCRSITRPLGEMDGGCGPATGVSAMPAASSVVNICNKMLVRVPPLHTLLLLAHCGASCKYHTHACSKNGGCLCIVCSGGEAQQSRHGGPRSPRIER